MPPPLTTRQQAYLDRLHLEPFGLIRFDRWCWWSDTEIAVVVRDEEGKRQLLIALAPRKKQ